MATMLAGFKAGLRPHEKLAIADFLGAAVIGGPALRLHSLDIAAKICDDD